MLAEKEFTASGIADENRVFSHERETSAVSTEAQQLTSTERKSAYLGLPCAVLQVGRLQTPNPRQSSLSKPATNLLIISHQPFFSETFIFYKCSDFCKQGDPIFP